MGCSCAANHKIVQVSVSKPYLSANLFVLYSRVHSTKLEIADAFFIKSIPPVSTLAKKIITCLIMVTNR
ncbi:unnamed protein product [Acanthoscelides obtectus]|uniref:Uncharacterized protein n=1 Tax=Acanthoscelides obtectus TaxID=200917 RepID=A0A9P0P6T2_ACAOB|nr:unnamed protein product [Acanthoscelides obtectus]CAK1640040.1 hypothetical protein AOBTE_LOCUS11522 [Acanthoscelides obtectus]